MEIIRVVRLNKAVKPYSRTRKGKLEHVQGHERAGLRRVSSAGGFLAGDERLLPFAQEAGKYGYNLKLIDKKPKDYYGKHFSGSKTIEIYTKGRTLEQIQATLYHEIGHIVDYQRRGIIADPMGDSIRGYDGKYEPASDSDIYFRNNLLKKEADKIRQELPKTHTASTTQKEIYADAYKIYKNTPDKLKEIAPNIYKQIDGFLTQGLLSKSKAVRKAVEDGMKNSVFVVSLDEALDKAVEVKPYTRTRRGKMERVGEYSRAGEKGSYATEHAEMLREKKPDEKGKPGEKEEYDKLKEFSHLLNDEGKSRLTELETKLEGEDRKKYEAMKMAEEHLSDTGKKHLAELETKFGKKKEEKPKEPKKATPKPIEVEKPKAEEKEEKPEEKKEKPEEKKEKPGDVDAEALASSLGFKLKSGPEKYKNFFSPKGALNLSAYHSDLKSDEEKMECLIHGVASYRECYVEKGVAGVLWADPEFKKVNGEIGRSEGIRRAFLGKARGYTNPKEQRQALHVAIGYQSKTEWPEKYAKFNKSEDGLKIFTLDELYKSKGPWKRGKKEKLSPYRRQFDLKEKRVNRAIARQLAGKTGEARYKELYHL